MRFWYLLVVAWMPVLQVLLAGLLGACLASSRFNVLTSYARRSINKIVYIVFVPSLVFSSLAGTVTLKDVISWWFMPVNMGIIFLIGATLGWLVVKALNPGQHLQGLVIACSSAGKSSVTCIIAFLFSGKFSTVCSVTCIFPGNWGTIPLMIVPAICSEEDSPFGDANTCKSLGLSYVSLSMALGNFFIWTHSYSVMKRSAQLYNKGCNDHLTTNNIRKEQNSGEDQNGNYAAFLPLSSVDSCKDVPNNSVSATLPSSSLDGTLMHYFRRAKDLLVEILKELWSPPSVAALVGFTVGAIDKLKSLVTGEDSPLRVVQDTAQLLGDAAIPCTVLILGGNLTKVPPAMSIGTIAQLFDVGEDECSIVFLWTHLVAALALTLWSTVFMSLVS
ncbi:hypothetical protein ACQ4PT_054153 [Festuca glaucescens]